MAHTKLTKPERKTLELMIQNKLGKMTDSELQTIYENMVKALDKRNPDCGMVAQRWIK